MALFIDVEVAAETSADPEVVDKLVEVCPVNVFGRTQAAELEILDENLDECTLCELCLQAAPPGTVRIRKLYDASQTLERSACSSRTAQADRTTTARLEYRGPGTSRGTWPPRRRFSGSV